MFNGLIYISAGRIASIPEQYIENINVGQEENFLSLKDIELIAERFIENREFPSDQKLPWAYRAALSKNTDINKLETVIRTLAEKARS